MYRTFTEIKAALKKGRSVQDILNKYLENIKERDGLNAYLEVFEASATKQAIAIDEKRKAGKAGRLAGMVIGIKDNICYKNHKVSAASKILEGFESVFSATAIERLIAEDAIIVGRLNCDEFAMGSSNENSAYGSVKNALNEDYVPGGSSGGSATAVAGNLCTVALGSDTGGSIRQPASYTGTIGFKPTYGRISRYGLIAYASSFDQIGPVANDIKDIALVTEIMAGKDEYDSTVSSKEVPSLTPQPLKSKLKIAYIKETLDTDGIDPEIKARTEQLVNCLRADGHDLIPVSFSYIEQIVPTYYVLTTAEASSNLSRFDGVHFGYRSKAAKGVEETYVKSRSEGFGEEVKRRIMAGTFVLSQGYYDAYYTKAQKVRRLIQDRTLEILNQHDCILLPTTPSTAFELNAVKDPINMYLQDIYTVQANLSGNPAISLPLGKHSNGMPFGLQLIGKHFGEKELIDISAYLMEFC
ncbi:Asp-tRNA(Asn)/Glu-tRNA(Gln) amidotransferase GatCAB subunit A [Brumimicrobium salinarum]|uniref:Glutamyl-tRNA(Gln) amidotransferase subunit A n=1 Tax=Brumimicrobium salinarum TaxID=2058658 RepID=A0A2I0QZB0_9FLAO|nr:Asp-tRNA(Asn)/Glu-tRNA(Gln) amidotransferase subunit GatA [Brumimicrobium salinarum]PKR79658.1 Asp-tRNA(Asn)/Glu-tRNA(Gln) amidotransferase GatCAB subunit A [Brumimicrobium salinarum]